MKKVEKRMHGSLMGKSKGKERLKLLSAWGQDVCIFALKGRGSSRRNNVGRIVHPSCSRGKWEWSVSSESSDFGALCTELCRLNWNWINLVYQCTSSYAVQYVKHKNIVKNKNLNHIVLPRAFFLLWSTSDEVILSKKVKKSSWLFLKILSKKWQNFHSYKNI